MSYGNYCWTRMCARHPTRATRWEEEMDNGRKATPHISIFAKQIRSGGATQRSAHMPHLAASPASAFAVAAAGGGRAGFRPPPRAATRVRASATAAGGAARAAVVDQQQRQQPTFYDLLGISAEGSSFEDVRAAYRRMARKYHPDVSPPDAAKEHTRRFIQVQEAYETLSDPSRRTSYDRALARGVCRLAFSPAARRHDASAFYHQEQEEKSGWRTSWEGQISELKKRSTVKDAEENLSWGAQMRRRRAEQS